MTDSHTSPDQWPNDVLGRKGFADFLTASLVGESQIAEADQDVGLTIALDADWGAGKTFFVRNWANDLENIGYPVVFFDAWENDIGDEASVALMAAIKTVLDKWSAQLPKSKAIQRKASAAASGAIKGLRRAIAPATKIVATSVVKKLTGVAVDDLIASVSGSERELSKNLADATSKALESGLDELFKRTLEEHQRRGEAIKSFKQCVGETIALLENQLSAEVPVFVFIDEVDRCRPTYAIRLLEEVKHIFGMPKMCFIVSTNISQLQESVRAVYGPGFDGHRYLKRFFDRQYTLPSPDNESFSAQLLSAPSLLTSRTVVHGLPFRDKSTTQNTIAIIANAFGLDLRSQKQVFSIATAAAGAIPKNRKIFVMWLYFLCAVQHRKPQLVESLHRGLDRTAFSALSQEVLLLDPEIEYEDSHDPFERRPERRTTKLSEVLWSYYTWSQGDLVKLRDQRTNSKSYSYPASNLQSVLEEAPNPYDASQKYPPSISRYLELVKYAGMTEAL